MTEATWAEVEAALAAAGARGSRIRVWLRDDDAVEVTPALARLAALTEANGMPVLLAVIPAGATAALAAWVSAHPLVTACQHGLAHTNHARPGERACELGGDRPDAAVLADLATGRARFKRLFGPAASDILVPPWNRIRDSLVPALPGLGFAALSTFAPATPRPAAALPHLDSDLDIMDWRNGRRGRSDDDLCGRLVRRLAAAAGTSLTLGILTHHLAHDETAWSFLERILPTLRRHGAVEVTNAQEELARRKG